MSVANENKSLPDEAVQEIQDYVIDNYQKPLVGRQILTREDVSGEKTTYKHYRVTSEMVNAEIIAPKGSYPREDLKDMEPVLEEIKKVGLGYEISMEDYRQENWVNRSIREITHKVALKEDDMIINGDATWGVNGIADVTPNTITAEDNWDSPGSGEAQPTKDLIDAQAKIQEQSDDRFGSDMSDLVLLANPRNVTELNHQFAELDHERAINYFENALGEIFTSPQVTEGEAFLMETGQDIARLVVADDVTVRSPEFDMDNDTYKGNIFTRTLPVFLQYGDTAGESTAFVKIDNI